MEYLIIGQEEQQIKLLTIDSIAIHFCAREYIEMMPECQV